MAEKDITQDIKSMNIHQRLLEIGKELKPVKRNAYNKFEKYSYSDISTITVQLKAAAEKWRVRFDYVKELPMETGYFSPLPTAKEGVKYLYHSIAIVNIVNVDNPEDCLVKEIPCFGTNGMVEKGHGAGQTYMYKFLYKNMFLINDSEDDPDMDDIKTVMSNPQPVRPQKPTPKQTPKAPAPAENSDDTFSDENQTRTTVKPSAYGELYRLGAEAGLTNDQIKAGIKKTLGNRAESEMTLAEFNKLKRSLTKKIEALGENTDGE